MKDFLKKEGFNSLGRRRKANQKSWARPSLELPDNQGKEGKMQDFLLLLSGAKKQHIPVERDTCPWGAVMRGSRGNPRRS